jgi:uncharacterized glyoxalase superfamily protein PhnB
VSTKAVPMIHVPDVRAAVEWYKMVGFQFLESHEEEGEMTWAALSIGSTELMLNAGGHVSDADRRDVDLYIYTEDVAAVYERLEELVNVIAPINDTFYGNREFIVRDLNSFWLTFGQPLHVMEQ